MLQTTQVPLMTMTMVTTTTKRTLLVWAGARQSVLLLAPSIPIFSPTPQGNFPPSEGFQTKFSTNEYGNMRKSQMPSDSARRLNLRQTRYDPLHLSCFSGMRPPLSRRFLQNRSYSGILNGFIVYGTTKLGRKVVNISS